MGRKFRTCIPVFGVNSGTTVRIFGKKQDCCKNSSASRNSFLPASHPEYKPGLPACQSFTLRSRTRILTGNRRETGNTRRTRMKGETTNRSNVLLTNISLCLSPHHIVHGDTQETSPQQPVLPVQEMAWTWFRFRAWPCPQQRRRHN